MTLTVPNATSASYAAQAQLDSGDLAALVNGIAGTGVVSGCAVTAQGTPNMTVAVAAGSMGNSGATANVVAANLTISAADPVLARFDLIVVSSAGALSVVQGTSSLTPVFPTVPSGSAVLATVYIPANTAAITNALIIDKRVNLAGIPVFNVKAYGALGNGSTDDTTAIQAAITAAQTAGSGTVYFPAGTYMISGTLTVTADNISLIGAGWNTQIKAMSGFVPTLMLWYKAPNTGYRMGCVIRNLSFHGNQQASLTAMLQLDSIKWALVDNCELLQHPTIGLYLNSSNGTFGAYNNVTNCVFHDSYTGTAVKTNNSEWVNFQNCRFLLYNLSGAIGISTINLNININACMFDAMDTAIYMQSGQYNNITGCQFDEGNTYYIHLNGCNANTIVGNTFNQHTGTGTDVIYVEGAGNRNNIIANNLVQTSTGWTNFVHEANGVGGSPGNSYIGNDIGSTTMILVTGIAHNNRGYNPVGHIASPAVPNTTVAYTNAFGVDCTVYVSGGTVTAIAIGGTATGLTSGTFRVPAGQTIAITYSVQPTWVWFGE